MRVLYIASFASLFTSLFGGVASTISKQEATTLIRRHLEQNNEYSSPVEDYEYNLANFSLRFDRCQYVKMYDDEMAQDEESESPLAVRHFAVYRLCPSDSCQNCDGGVFGRYVTELDQYLQYTVAEEQTILEYMCNNCQEQCDEYGQNCSGCGKICYHLQNLAANGYIDAANYIQCQMLEINNGNDAGDANQNGQARFLEDQNDEQLELYIGPRCSNDGSKVLLGLFTDADCLEPYTEAEPEDFLNGRLSYHTMTHASSNDGTYCLSCMENNDNANEEDQADGDNVNEMCERIYDESAKCESKYGLYGFVDKNREEGDHENQIENEFMVCSFIESLLLNSYTETGDINLDGDTLIVTRKMTKTQKVSLSMLSLIILGLGTTVYFLKQQIERSTPKLDLSSQSADHQLT